MMQSAPISRAAATVFSRCCAASVSTVGTPVMSMIAIERAGVDDALQQALHHDLRAGAVERADERQRQDAVPQRDDRRRQLQQLLLLADDHLLASALVHLGRVEAEPVEQRVGRPRSRRRARSGLPRARAAAARTAAASARRRTSPSPTARTPAARAPTRARRASARDADPGGRLDVRIAGLRRVAQQRQEAPRLIRELLPADAIGSERRR